MSYFTSNCLHEASISYRVQIVYFERFEQRILQDAKLSISGLKFIMKYELTLWKLLIYNIHIISNRQNYRYTAPFVHIIFIILVFIDVCNVVVAYYLLPPLLRFFSWFHIRFTHLRQSWYYYWLLHNFCLAKVLYQSFDRISSVI